MKITRRAFAGAAAAFAAAGHGMAEGTSAGAVSGTLFGMEKFATHDGPGIRTVAFLKGCPLRCVWCHSPESWSYRIEKYANGETVGWQTTAAEVVAEFLKDRDFYVESGGGVTISGGEPLAQAEFAVAILRLAKEAGLHTAIETSGFAPDKVIQAALPYVDLWLYDVKELDAAKYLQYMKRPIAATLANLRTVDAWCCAKAGKGTPSVTLRLPMIPGLNDDEAELAAIGRLADSLGSVKGLDVEPYVPYGVDKAKRLGLEVYSAPRPPQEYGEELVRKLAALTHKPVRLG